MICRESMCIIDEKADVLNQCAPLRHKRKGAYVNIC